MCQFIFSIPICLDSSNKVGYYDLCIESNAYFTKRMLLNSLDNLLRHNPGDDSVRIKLAIDTIENVSYIEKSQNVVFQTIRVWVDGIGWSNMAITKC